MESQHTTPNRQMAETDPGQNKVYNKWVNGLRKS